MSDTTDPQLAAGNRVDQAIDAEAQAQAICRQTQDFRRAHEAFAAKAKPRFAGN